MKKKKILLYIFVLAILLNVSVVGATETDILVLNEIKLSGLNFNDNLNWTLDVTDLETFLKFAWKCKLKDNLSRDGLAFDDVSIKKYLDSLPRAVEVMCGMAVDKLMNCDGLKRTHKEKFEKNIKKRPRNLIFFLGYDNPSIDAIGNINLPDSYLIGIFKYIAKKVAETEANNSDISFDDIYDNRLVGSFISTIGHEMLHAYAELNHPSSSENERFECVVYCIQFLCFPGAAHPGFPSYCREDRHCKNLGLPAECIEAIQCKEKPSPPPTSAATSSDNERSKEASDDNFSFSSGMYLFSSLLSAIDTLPVNMGQEFFSFTYSPDILIYDKFSYPDLPTLLEKDIDSNYIDDYTHDCFSTNHKLLIIPSGELMGEENSGIIKQALEQFVASGGTLLVLAQQYNTHFENLVPVPEGETLTAYGWRQDQSCYNGAVYFDTLHPVVCSSTSGLVTATNDGYFDAWPSTATVLLNRTKNREGALLYYPYGENGGHVILASLYTDWGYAHSQATSAEIKIIRDLITFAKNPNLPIPMHNLEENANPDITLDVVVKNNTDSPAGKVKVIVSDPNREIILYESEENVMISPGEETAIPVHFTLPAMQSSSFGICHADYLLYDTENNLLQGALESYSGRFAVYGAVQEYTPADGIDMWLTVKDELIMWYEVPTFTLHIKNHTAEDKSMDFDYHCDHEARKPLFTVDVPAGQEVERQILLENEPPFVRLFLHTDSNRTISKSVQMSWSYTNSTLTLNSPLSVKPGGTLDYTITSHYQIPPPRTGQFPVRVVLERRNGYTNEYLNRMVIYETGHDFSIEGDLYYHGTYVPPAPLPGGMYRISLEVEDPDGRLDPLRSKVFTYQNSGYTVHVGNVKKDDKAITRLTPGVSYTIPLILRNIANIDINDYEVIDGKYILVLESESGVEVYRKEVNNINVKSGEEIKIPESFTFTPAELGYYYLKTRYWDETMVEPSYLSLTQKLLYETYVSLSANKEKYELLDTAAVSVNISGSGAYTVHFTCANAGIDETRAVQLGDGQNLSSEIFQVPMGSPLIYPVIVQVTDASGIGTWNTCTLYRERLLFAYSGNFSQPYAVAGNDMSLAVTINGLSGMSRPLAGELSVTCPALEYEDIKTVTLQPLTDNPFTYTITVTEETPPATYRFDVSFKIAGVEYIRKDCSFVLAGAAAAFTAPASTCTTGDTLTLQVQNTGGKSGTFDIEVSLQDVFYRQLAVQKTTHIIPALGTISLNFPIPTGLKTGNYLLALSAVETSANTLNDSAFPLSGLQTGAGF